MGAIAGIDGTSDRIKGLEPITIAFSPGESQLSGDQIAALTVVRNLMRKDATVEVTIQHELGSDDVALADERINLESADADAIVNRLLARKQELRTRYAEECATLVATMATGDNAQTEADASRLRGVAVELHITEDGLDSVFDQLRPGADSLAPRRTRAAAILLGDLRLRTVQGWLLNADIRDAAERVRKANATFSATEAGQGHIRIVVTRRAKT